MTLVVVLAVLAGLGLCVAVDALAPARPALSTVLAALNTTALPEPAATARGEQLPGWLGRLLGPGLRAAHRAGLPRPSVLQDLALLDRDPATHLAGQLVGGLAGLLAPSALLALAAVAGAPVGWQLPLWTGLAGAVTGVVLPHLSVRSQAAKRRTELRHSLTVLLSLVATALAGAAGVEQAITDASRIGTNWGATRLRATIDAAAAARVAPWAALGRLGTDTGIPALRDLASAVLLAEREGASVADTLTVRAATLRARQAANLKAAAKSASQRMVLPLLLLGLGYLLFLLYPAIQAVKASLGS
jgi:Flp pilus assembly protein TadB